MAKRLFQWLIVIFIFNDFLISEENWNSYSGSSKSYSKKILTIGMQFHFIHFEAVQNSNTGQVLVFLNDTKSSDWYFKTLYEKLGTDVSLFEYKTNSKIYPTVSSFESNRLQHYLKEKKLTTGWPPLFPEIREIQRELMTGDFRKKYLLLTGRQSNLLIQTKLIENFDRIILVSPDANTDRLEKSGVSGKKLLWVGGLYESEKLNALKDKLGGDVLVYQRSSSGKNLLMSNFKTLDDILSWIRN